MPGHDQSTANAEGLLEENRETLESHIIRQNYCSFYESTAVLVIQYQAQVPCLSITDNRLLTIL